MQTDATDLIVSALRLLSEVSPGETLSSDELADGLTVANQMLDSLSAEQTLIPYLTHETFVLTGAASYTIGATGGASGGTLTSTRPLRVLAGSTVDTAGASHPLRIVTAAEWEAIPDKTRTGLFAEVLFSDGGYPMNTYYLTPKPVAGSLMLDSLKPLMQFADLTTTIDVAPGYLHFLRHQLAFILAPEYGRDPATVAGALELAKAAIVTLNAQTLGPVAPEQAPQAPQQQQAA